MGDEGGEDEVDNLEFTPSWVVAALCTLIISLSLAVERLIHFTGKYLTKKNQKSLFRALQKVKEELMLLGFISLLLSVFQQRIIKICVPPHIMQHLLPCPLPGRHDDIDSNIKQTKAYSRHLLSDESAFNYCKDQHKVPILSMESMHHIHIFISVLALVHVAFTALTIVFGIAKIRKWKHWEDSITKDYYNGEQDDMPRITHVREHDFIKQRFRGIGKRSTLLGWLQSFFKQFYGSLTQSDYHALRLGFVMTHCRGNPKFNFHKYMIRALEDDFKKVVGIRWYLWGFVIIFLLLNVNGWHTYFWMVFIPFTILIAVGTKLEHVIYQLAHEVAEKHDVVEGDLIVKPSNDHFWFGQPRIILVLIHFILFQNAFEIAFFFWIWVQFGLRSCYMGRIKFITPRILTGVFVQLLCSYSTLPLYAIVTQMGTYFKKSMFDENIQAGLVDWAQKAKKRRESLKANSSNAGEATQDNGNGDTTQEIQLEVRSES